MKKEKGKRKKEKGKLKAWCDFARSEAKSRHTFIFY
jgi:hypothetical protein